MTTSDATDRNAAPPDHSEAANAVRYPLAWPTISPADLSPD
jgi:hypothetical protein